MVRSAAAVLAVLIIPTFAQAQEPSGTHTVVRGNTLWDLSAHYYQDPFQWRTIWEANRDVVEDPNWIYPDEVLVIPGLPANADAGGQAGAGDPEADPTAAETPTQPTPSEEAPSAEGVPADFVGFGFRSPRPSDEVRTVFYRDTAAARASVVLSRQFEYVAVTEDAVYSAPWLIGLEAEPEHAGVLVGFAEGGRASTIRSYESVRVEMPTPARVGARLQIFRVSRTIDMVGQAVIPTGVLEVTTIGAGYVVGTVLKEYARVQPGDLVRALPAYSLQPGQYAEEVSGGSEAMIMGFAGTQVINELGHFAFLDLGSDDGITIGDEFVLYGTAVPTDRQGSLQIVGVSATTSTARVVSLTDDVFHQGVVVRLAKKMR